MPLVKRLQEIRASFTGPAFLPWNRMANIDKWDGPLPQSYIDGQLQLQKQILARERGFGMKPVLPAFAGHVPAALKRVKPDMHATRLATWEGMTGENAVSFDPKDPLFREIQVKFLREEAAEIGTDHLYGADPFNEMTPPSWEPAYLAGVSSAIYTSMSEADPDARWVQMGWTFETARKEWNNSRLKAMISAVPLGRMIILDYFCEETEMYPKTENFFGAPVIWCYLGNFGGNNYIVGPLNKVNTRFTSAMSNPDFPNLAGVGATLEGFGNQSVYECLFERAWAGANLDLQAWFKNQAQCHAGGPDPAVEEAWDMLRTRIMVDDNVWTSHGHCVFFQSVPRLTSNGRYGRANPKMPYDNADLIAVWRKLLDAGPTARAQDAYLFDLADVTRQALGNSGESLRASMLEAYKKKDAEAFRKCAARFMEMGRDLDTFLGTRPEFLLGKWVGDARAWGKDAAEADYYERDSRTILSTWGGRNSPLTDYASKCWNGMLASYYLARWDIYLKAMADDLDKGEHNAKRGKELDEKMKDLEWAWARQAEGNFKSKPQGDVFEMSRALYRKYLR